MPPRSAGNPPVHMNVPGVVSSSELEPVADTYGMPALVMIGTMVLPRPVVPMSTAATLSCTISFAHAVDEATSSFSAHRMTWIGCPPIPPSSALA